MRFFLDTEFYEDGKTIELISIALVKDADDPDYFYAENLDFNWNRLLNPSTPREAERANWLIKNVVPHLDREFAISMDALRTKLLHYLSPYLRDMEFWADYGAYDWVAFCQIFGTMMDLPLGFPMYCNDLMTLSAALNHPKMSDRKPNEPSHSALGDALWLRRTYRYLQRLKLDGDKDGY